MRLINYIIGKGRDKEAYIHREKPRNKHGTLFRIGVISAVAVVALNVGIIGYAVYQNQASSNSNNSIKSADYAQDIKIDSGNASTVAMKNNLLTSDLALNGHTVLITPKSDAGYSLKGFCVITVSDKDAQGQPRADRKFRTEIINAGSTFTLNLQVLNEFGNSVKFEPFWGDPNNYNDYKNLAVITSAGTDIGEEPASQVKYNTFTHSDNFANVDSYLYRVGNGNTVKLGALFKVDTAGDSAVDPSKVKIKVTAEEPDSSVKGSGTNLESGSTAMCVYTKNASDWLNSTLRFTGEGPVKVTICEDTGDTYTLNLEIVNGNNATTATSATSNNVILLNNVSGGLSVSNGYTLYGNGFSVTDTRSQTSGTNGYVTLGSCTVDDVRFIGYEASEAVASGISNQNYAPAVLINGSANIYRSYFYGGRYAIMCNGTNADVYMYDSVIDGGAIANLCFSSGNLTLENCKTTTSTHQNGLKGLGIHVNSSTVKKLSLIGTFEQHNWLKSSQISNSTYRNALSSVYDDSNYVRTYNSEKYINMGIFFATDSANLLQTFAESVIDDKTSNNYGYIEKTVSGFTATCYTAKASEFSTAMLAGAQYTPNQYYTLPSSSFDFTNKNYKAKTEGNDNYCYYDSNTKKVNFSFVTTDSVSDRTWDPDILSVTKYSNNLSVSWEVTEGSPSIVDGKLVFSQSGDYIVKYSYTDPYNYNVDLDSTIEVTYYKYVYINVTAVEPEAVVYPPAFTYVSTWEKSAKMLVANNKTYIMPDISSTNSNFGSTSVSGKTIYYPIIQVDGKNSSAGNYNSGEIFCFAPAFRAINIVDYNQSNGASQYTYNSSAQKWPHEKSNTGGPDSSVFGWGSTHPWEVSSGASGRAYSYTSSMGGLCFKSGGFGRDVSAATRLVEFYYVGNDGNTYYYYIAYNYTATTYKKGSCFAKGTLITLADGTQKPIEEVSRDDRIRTWNFFTGQYDEKGIAILVDHGEEEYEVANLTFSNGTVLRTIADHGLFDFDANKFVYILPDNCEDFINHRFVMDNGDVGYDIVTLTDAEVTVEVTNAYSITSSENMNAFANGLLTLAPPEEFYNWIPMGETLMYDVEAFEKDVETYGLYDYETFKDYVTYEQYLAFNGAYLKIPVSKGIFSFDSIIDLIILYRDWLPMDNS